MYIHTYIHTYICMCYVHTRVYTKFFGIYGFKYSNEINKLFPNSSNNIIFTLFREFTCIAPLIMYFSFYFAFVGISSNVNTYACSIELTQNIITVSNLLRIRPKCLYTVSNANYVPLSCLIYSHR